MSPERPEERSSGRIPAQQRLAQTRSEIAALILPPPPVTAQAARRHAAAQQQQQRAYAEAEMAAMLRQQQQGDLAAADHIEQTARMEYMRQAAAMPPSAHPARAAAPAARGASAFAWKPMLRRGLSIWWRHHPAHAVVEVADSMLSHVARRKPWQMLAVAAGVGALAMLIRPWRLISVPGLALGALKMSDTRSLLGTLLRGD